MNIVLLYRLCYACVLLLALALSATAQNLLTNPSFETGTVTFNTTLLGYNAAVIPLSNTTMVTGWTADFADANTGWVVQRLGTDPLFASYGSRFVYLDAWESCFRNTVTLQPGNRYTLSACIAGLDRDGTAGDEASTFSLEFDLDGAGGAVSGNFVNGQNEYNINTIPASQVAGNFSSAQWNTYSWTFTLAGNNTQAPKPYDFWISSLNGTAAGQNRQLGIAVDCVSLSAAAIPDASSFSLLSLAGGILLLRRKRTK
jgi:hypothetical protein